MIQGVLAQYNSEHSDVSNEFESVESFFKRLILIYDLQVLNLVNLINIGDSVLDKLSKLNDALDGVGDSLDNDLGLLDLLELLNGSVEVSADSNVSLYSDFVVWQGIVGLDHLSIFFCHYLYLILNLSNLNS